jgi:predicted nucleic acid-binding protein
LQWTEDALGLDAQTHQDLARIREIIAKYADLPADFADASLVALAERRGLFAVASVDSDFTVYRGATRRRFRNLFFE